MQEETALDQETASTKDQFACARWVNYPFFLIYLSVFLKKRHSFAYKYDFVCRLLQLLNPDPINPDSESLDNDVSVEKFCFSVIIIIITFFCLGCLFFFFFITVQISCLGF